MERSIEKKKDKCVVGLASKIHTQTHTYETSYSSMCAIIATHKHFWDEMGKKSIELNVEKRVSEEKKRATQKKYSRRKPSIEKQIKWTKFLT